ncbi:hypothetical protein [Mycoplasma enhydrae]|uniref:hypothetical protein n=1 Tax=Mycoplasma enhydrae TaxID=2499220 RepID=UPI00197C4852|nr:hypothetical protein [Mycoplasma enhydrae]MBN4089230.1 hypothetical protein [Mycoplasma enhydrae]
MTPKTKKILMISGITAAAVVGVVALSVIPYAVLKSNKQKKSTLEQKTTEALNNVDLKIKSVPEGLDDKSKLTASKKNLEESKKELETLKQSAQKSKEAVLVKKIEVKEKEINSAIAALSTKIELHDNLEAIKDQDIKTKTKAKLSVFFDELKKEDDLWITSNLSNLGIKNLIGEQETQEIETLFKNNSKNLNNFYLQIISKIVKKYNEKPDDKAKVNNLARDLYKEHFTPENIKNFIDDEVYGLANHFSKTIELAKKHVELIIKKYNENSELKNNENYTKLRNAINEEIFAKDKLYEKAFKEIKNFDFSKYPADTAYNQIFDGIFDIVDILEDTRTGLYMKHGIVLDTVLAKITDYFDFIDILILQNSKKATNWSKLNDSFLTAFKK